MNSARHFALSFFGPIIAGAGYCALIGFMWDMLEKHRMSPLIIMLIGVMVVASATRWMVRNLIPVRCPFCAGKSYEIQGRGNRFMCSVCGKDH